MYLNDDASNLPPAAVTQALPVGGGFGVPFAPPPPPPVVPPPVTPLPTLPTAFPGGFDQLIATLNQLAAQNPALASVVARLKAQQPGTFVLPAAPTPAAPPPQAALMPIALPVPLVAPGQLAVQLAQVASALEAMDPASAAAVLQQAAQLSAANPALAAKFLRRAAQLQQSAGGAPSPAPPLLTPVPPLPFGTPPAAGTQQLQWTGGPKVSDVYENTPRGRTMAAIDELFKGTRRER